MLDNALCNELMLVQVVPLAVHLRHHLEDRLPSMQEVQHVFSIACAGKDRHSLLVFIVVCLELTSLLQLVQHVPHEGGFA